MSDESFVSLRIDRRIHSQMKLHDEINWSAILRRAILQKIEQLESINETKAREAAKSIDKIRKSGTFNKGKSSVELIREWRDKRK